MEYVCKLFILLSVFCASYGNLRQPTGLLLGAHQQIHSTIPNVAEAVLSGLQGLNVDLIGGLGHHHYTGYRPQSPGNAQTEAVVIIVEEVPQTAQKPARPTMVYQPYDVYQHNRYPPNNGHQSHNGHKYHNYGHNHYPNSPGYNGQGHDTNYGYPNQNNRPNPNYNGNENNKKRPGNHDSENNGIHYKPTTEVTIKNSEPNKPNIVEHTPTEASSQNNGLDNKPIHEVTTKKPATEEPQLVPVNPNDYVYGGDKITINVPKQESDKNEAAEDTDEFPIDIRIKDE